MSTLQLYWTYGQYAISLPQIIVLENDPKFYQSNVVFHLDPLPAGNFDVESTWNWRRKFDVKIALKNERIYRRSSKKGRNFEFRLRYFNGFYRASKKSLKIDVESTLKNRLCRLGNCLSCSKSLQERKKSNQKFTVDDMMCLKLPCICHSLWNGLIHLQKPLNWLYCVMVVWEW